MSNSSVYIVAAQRTQIGKKNGGLKNFLAHDLGSHVIKSLIKKIDLEPKNIDEVINDIRPPIFWKEKDDLKKQVNMWDFGDLKNKIYRINEIEALIKSNSKNSLNILSDFIVNY